MLDPNAGKGLGEAIVSPSLHPRQNQFTIRCSELAIGMDERGKKAEAGNWAANQARSLSHP